MRVADQEEEEAPGVHADVHPELHVTGRRLRTRDDRERVAHADSRSGRAQLVTLAVEEDQQRVAAELQQAAAMPVGDVEQRGERRVHHVRHLLGACASERRELLGHRGETGDVDERERAVTLDPQPLGMVGEPLDRQPRDERNELARRPGTERDLLIHSVILRASSDAIN